MVDRQESARARWQPISVAICGLMVVASVSFAAASIIHFGTVIALGPITIDDSFPGAAPPEGVIAIVLGIGWLSVLARWPARWRIALATSLFALLLTIYGLTVTLGSTRTGDIAYHVSVLVLLVLIVGLLFLPAGRHSLSD